MLEHDIICLSKTGEHGKQFKTPLFLKDHSVYRFIQMGLPAMAKYRLNIPTLKLLLRNQISGYMYLYL